MGLFKFRRAKAVEPLTATNDELSTDDGAAEQVIPREKFTMESRIESVELPIFIVYNRLSEDWETKGYTDAREFPESSYKESRKSAIVEKLALLIEESTIKYNDKITEMDTLIEQSRKNGFIETLSRQERKKETLVRHLKELTELSKDVKSGGTKTKAILTSYDMGFSRGIASIGDDKVKTIMG